MNGYENFPAWSGICYNEDPPAGGGTGGAGGAGDPPAGGGGGGTPPVFDQTYVSKLRNENAAERVARQAAEAKVAEYERKQREAEEQAAKEKGDWEKLAKDRERELEKERAKNAEALRQKDLRIINADIKKVVEASGMLPDAAAKLDKFIDMSKVTLDAEGNIQGAQEQIDALKQEMPFLFTSTPGTGGSNPGNGAPPAGGDGRPGGAAPPRGTGNAGTVDYRNREAVPAAVFKSAWDNLGKR